MIAVTGATGFVGRELVKQLADAGEPMRCWRRANSDTKFANDLSADLQWVQGQLGNGRPDELLDGCQTVVHTALWRPGQRFQGAEGDVVEFAKINILGTLELIQAAVKQGIKKFVYVSTCAVHDEILDDRPLDETHPLWPHSHYGAHKAAIEKFVHSFGLGDGFPICALRPTGIYGVAQPISNSKWYSLIQKVAAGKDVEVSKGGKEVHVADVAKSIRTLIDAPDVAGQVYSCYDRYISEFDVATLAKEICGSPSQIVGEPKTPKHQIETAKLRGLGMEFGGRKLLEATIRQLLF